MTYFTPLILKDPTETSCDSRVRAGMDAWFPVFFFSQLSAEKTKLLFGAIDWGKRKTHVRQRSTLTASNVIFFCDDPTKPAVWAVAPPPGGDYLHCAEPALLDTKCLLTWTPTAQHWTCLGFFLFKIFLFSPVDALNLERITAFNCTGGSRWALCNCGAFACTTWCWPTDEVCLLETLNKKRRIKGPFICKTHFLIVFEPSNCLQPVSELPTGEKVPVQWPGSQTHLHWFLLQVGSVTCCEQVLAPPSWKQQEQQ